MLWGRSFKKKNFQFLLCGTLGCSLLFMAPSPAHAFFKKKKIKKSAPQTDVAETFLYRVFFTIEPSSDKPTALSGSWVELNYKLVNGGDIPGPLFANAPGGKVRFLDKDGFVLASDFFLNEDFQKTDFYSSLWVEKKRSGAIVTADAVPLKDDELEVLQRERAEKEEQKKMEDETFQMALKSLSAVEEPSVLPPVEEVSSEIHSQETVAALSAAVPPVKEPLIKVSAQEIKSASPSPVVSSVLPPAAESGTVHPSPLQGETLIIVQQAASEKGDKDLKGAPVVESAKIISEPVLVAVSSSAPASPAKSQGEGTAASPPVKLPTPPPDKKKELLAIDGPTNEDIQQTLSEMDKNPATKIEESPSKIPGISFEDEGTDSQ